MKRTLTAVLCILVCSSDLAQAQDIDKELSDLAEKLATPIKDHSKKKVTVLDFTDLSGGASDLGKYIAEQLTVNLVMGKREFAVLDRANLKSILAEHKLTATGLVDPENAKKLGMFAGVDALILGTITPRGDNISLTAKVITTDTAEIVGAARATFKSDSNVQQLVSHPASEPSDGAQPEKKPSVIKTFGDLRIELESLRIVSGRDFLLSLILTNQSPNKSLWIALGTDILGASVHSKLTGAGGNEFVPWLNDLSGIQPAFLNQHGSQPNSFEPATEIAPHDAISVTIKFGSIGLSAEPGLCNLQLELLVGRDYRNRAAINAKSFNLLTKIEAK